MRKMQAYLAGGLVILTSFFITQSCVKDTNSDDDVIGNWSRSSDFDGNARSEAVTFVIGDYIYLTTGSTDRDRFKDLWEYNLTRQYWSQKADLPGVARNSAGACAWRYRFCWRRWPAFSHRRCRLPSLERAASARAGCCS